MTQQLTPLTTTAPPRPPEVPAPRPSGRAVAPTWGWALVEIRADGSCGEPQVVAAPGSVEAGPPEVATTVPCSINELSGLLRRHLATTEVEIAGRHGVTAVLERAAGAAGAETRTMFVGPLAHVEALQGDLRRAERHAAQVRSLVLDHPGAPGEGHALLAEAWIALERASFGTTRRLLESLEAEVVRSDDPWLATSHLLLEAKLLVATGAPEVATRVLARRAGIPAEPTATDWLSELVTVTKAEALIASGEPHRAMAALTPVPRHAVVESLVVGARARHLVGDVRGALAMLSRAVADLDHAPLALQVDAWLLEARLSEHQRKPDRARLLTDRALRSASIEGLCRAVLRDWAWVRRFVESEPALLGRHQEFLVTCHQIEGSVWALAPSPPVARAHDERPSPSLLTERERQVLALLAQMYSTDEIAATLYVSSNTVKTHLKGIFGKLGVNRRVEAVRRGKVLGLC